MNPFFYFVLLLLALFILSTAVAQSIGSLVKTLTGSSKLTVATLAVIFLPGTIVHEFAHAAVAQGMGVAVGEMKLLPEVEGKYIKMGSVQVGQSDPFRNFLIGIAPLIVGFVIILLSFKIFDVLGLSGLWPNVVLFYILFQIGNTMFSSKRDMEGAVELFAAIFLFCILLYVLGFKSVFATFFEWSRNLDPFFKLASASLLKIVALDIVVVLLARLLITPLRSR